MLFVARVTVLDNQVLRKEIDMSSQEPPSEFAAPQTPPPGYPPQGYPAPQGYPPPQGYYAGPTVAPRRRRGPWFGCLITVIILASGHTPCQALFSVFLITQNILSIHIKEGVDVIA
jgi:hypothetical protein